MVSSLEGSLERVTGEDKPDDSVHLSDGEILSQIDSMAPEELVRRGDYVSRKGMMRHYGVLHREWIEKFDYYLGEEVGHKPCTGELVASPDFNVMCQRFRVFYGIKYPDKINWEE